ncbi:MAG: hypothetical protein ACW99U_06435 [Candidatus Thorarchaeota archaeon]
MTTVSDLLRVYICPKCSHIGYAKIQSKLESSNCSLCLHEIDDEPETIYASDITEARTHVANEVRSRRPSHRTEPRRGLGDKKRVIRIIDSIISMNRGWPVSLERVMKECTDAGIELSKASLIVQGLIADGLAIEASGDVSLAQGVEMLE